MAGKLRTSRPNKGAGHAASKTKKDNGDASANKEARISAAIEHAIVAIQVKLASDDAKPTVADLVRLLQLQKDLEGERPIDVTVRWVEEECNDNSSTGE